MIAFQRYTSGEGNASIYVRLRNAVGAFWDFVGLVWVTPITVNCKQFLMEVADGDPIQSFYVKNIVIPVTDIYAIESVRDASGEVLGYDSTISEYVASLPKAGSVID